MDEADSILPPRPESSRKLALSPAGEGLRLDSFLAASLEVSRGEARRLLERGAVFLEGRRLKLSDKGRIMPGRGEITVRDFRAPAEQRILGPGGGRIPEILARGSGWLAVDKPAGMPVHPLREGESDTVLNHLIESFPTLQGVGEGGLRSGVVHRLDVETSGVLLVATSASAVSRLRLAFQRHRVDKFYRAIAEGRPNWPGGTLTLELPLVVARHKPAFVRVAREAEVARGRARLIRQELQCLETLGGQTLLEIRPRTGFLHQIRASLAHLGHPLVGDGHYGATSGLAGARRPMLHAARLSFEDISASAREPDDFCRVQEELSRSGG